MRAEIQLLAASIALGLVHLFAGVAAATSQRGRAWCFRLSSAIYSSSSPKGGSHPLGAGMGFVKVSSP